MKQSYTWGNCQLNSLVLSKSHDKKVILTAMRKGTEIKYFQTNDPTTFKVIKGKLKFHNSTETIILNEGQFVTIDENTEYNIMTQEFTLILLTISFSLRKVTNS
jgi:quercetin dioxygenase-like cupin family protein